MSDKSPARVFAEAFAHYSDPADAHAHLDVELDKLSVLELAALTYDYANFWARSKQLIPRQSPGAPRFSSWGFLTGRGFGKTWSVAGFIVDEVIAGRAMRIACMAQSAEKTLEVMIEGQSGLINMSPAWFKPEWIKGRLVWPNGAQAFVYTPKEPDGPRGPEHHIAWLSELPAWPKNTRDEALSNIELGLRLGYALLLWDCTPKRRNAMIRKMLKRVEHRPEVNKITRGHTNENLDNLNPEKYRELFEELDEQTRKEELEGLFLDDSARALWKEKWITAHRRPAPSDYIRRILSIDPAISDRRTSDDTGFTELGLGVDDQIYVLADHSGKYAWEVWGDLAIDLYLAGKCDCIVLERNRGGDACAANLRMCAKPREIKVHLVQADAVTRHVPNVIYVKEITSTRSKRKRAEPVAVMARKGRISHVHGADLESLETTMLTWEPENSTDSPDALDAFVHGVWELGDLADTIVDNAKAFEGLKQVSQALQHGTVSLGQVSQLLGSSEWGSGL